MIFWLCHFGFRLLRRPHPFCCQNLMRGRVTYQKVYTFYSLALLLRLQITLHFTYLILWLCYLIFGIHGNSHPCCFWYLMSERVSTYPIISPPLVFPFPLQNFKRGEFHGSNILVLLSGLWTTSGSHPFYLRYPMQDRVKLIKVYASDLLPLSVSHAEESLIYQVLRV